MNLKKMLQAGILVCCMLWQSNFLIGQSNLDYVEKVKITANSMTFEFTDTYQNFTVEVSGPDNFYLKEELTNMQEWTINSTGFSGTAFLDGLYKVQVTPNLAQSKAEQKILRYLTETDQMAQLKAKKEILNIPTEIHSYNRNFRIKNNEFVLPRNEAYGLKTPTGNTTPTNNLSTLKLATSSARPTFTSLSLNAPQTTLTAEHLGLNPRPMFVAQVIATDLIVQGSECVGFDCVNGESFGFDTHRLKENNLRIHFDDTSNSASFAANDWRIVANDTSNGGANYLAFEDATAGRQLFRVDAGAPANSLYVDAQGDVGIGTNNAVVELHVKDGDSPTLRLEQDASSGFGAQTWDLASNETNFFIRDVTNGSKLPVRIQPNSPDRLFQLQANGRVGIGLANSFAAEQELHVDGNVAISGSILPVSDRRLKHNIFTIENALETIGKLRPTSYNFRTEEFADMKLLAGLQYGFIAQELEEILPTLVTNSNNPDKDKNFKRVNYTGVIPFLVKGMQEQQTIIDNQQEQIDALKAQLQDMNELKQQVAALAKMMETTAESDNATNTEKK